MKKIYFCFLIRIGFCFFLDCNLSYSQVTFADSTPFPVIVPSLPPFDINDWRQILVDSVEDIDGNRYALQQIGAQVWFVDNLKTTHFSDST